MSTGESVDFAEYHRERLERITGAAERIAAIAFPLWHYKARGSELMLEPSGIKERLDGESNEHEREALAIIENGFRHDADQSLAFATLLGVFSQIEGVDADSKERQEILAEQRTRGSAQILADSKGAYVKKFALYDPEGQDGEGQLTLKVTRIKSVGFREQPIDVKHIQVDQSDAYVTGSLAITEISGELGVRNKISPTEDDLVRRLVTASWFGSEGRSPIDRQLYDAGYAAVTGHQQAVAMINGVRSQMNDPEIKKLCDDLLERYQAVIESRQWEGQTRLPSVDKMDAIAVELEVIADQLEEDT